MAHIFVLAPDALADLRDPYDGIANASLPERAVPDVEGLRRFCLDLSDFPQRGTKRDTIRLCLRIPGYRRRLTIVFHVIEAEVVTDWLLYGGRELPDLLRNGNNEV